MNDKIFFILAAINDTQATIRAIDVKVGTLLAGLLLPLVIKGQIFNYLIKISNVISHSFGISVSLLLIFLWFVNVFILIRTISAIDNPAKHILDSKKFKGSFYGNGCYNFGALDIFLNREAIKANKNVIDFSKDYPSGLEEIVNELAFEHLQLVYIRDIKFHRLKIAFTMSFFWGISVICLFFFSELM
ncbi:MAG: hypothetical protein Q3M24_09115 [Candidatus Electrothrix aestuarii]|uniref:Uncharacterized protein n=1 Tax=Candidatus Electrothrix aestuarii TaxID=3062594 RepID=A0AAU8M0E1_9BACT|nr:hypothetical protein [Candidatus Electrothrix aestuarii]WPD23841.1 MAG: hypothetical protein SD837_04600 [Candidatus Electrothrix sp. GW3-3]